MKLATVSHKNIAIRAAAMLWLGVLVAVIASVQLSAQTPARDNRGKEFWVTFMANLGSQFNETSQMDLFLSCDRPTTATVSYHEDGSSVTVQIPTANVPVRVAIATLFGPNAELDDIQPNRRNEITAKSIKVTSRDEITLYGASIRTKSADAFMSLPVDVLTGRYIVLAYPNGFDRVQSDTYDTPSEFAVIATEDGTTIRITSPASVNGRSRQTPFIIQLDSGQVFFGQARLGLLQDVSGTEIVANKPVAVYGGVKRTAVPVSVGNYRDHIVEQIPALEAWGTEAIVTPHYPVTPSSFEKAVVRVLAAFDNTNWTLDGQPQPPLMAGRSVEFPLTKAMPLVADGPVLVAQYEHSVNAIDNTGESELGDPFMMLIPPPQQFDSVYSFQCVDHPEFVRHFVNVVIPSNATASVRIDGKPVAQPFTAIAGTRFSFAQIELPAGAHFARADSTFGLYSYGYGQANSYGYAGGMLFKTLVTDFQGPELFSTDTCGGVLGIVSDSRITDTGIDSLYITSQTQNANVVIDPFAPGADTARFRATLIDPYQDGTVAVKAIDGSGRSRFQMTRFPGFTLRTSGGTNGIITTDTLIAYNGGPFCRRFEIENYGMFQQRISNVRLLNKQDSGIVLRSFPETIEPGEKGVIEICYEGTTDTLQMVELLLEGNCAQRRVAIIPFIHRIDTTAPSISRSNDPCGRDLVLQLQEQNNASGIAELQYNYLENCTASTPAQTFAPAVQNVNISLNRVDPYKDMIFEITLWDAAGNGVVRRDTIGGFTLQALDAAQQPVSIRLNHDWIADSMTVGLYRCDTITLSNQGRRAVTIQNAQMLGNLAFSVPPSQFPITIAPGEERRLNVCLEGLLAGNQQGDTLVLTDICGTSEAIALKLPVTWLAATGQDGCNNIIRIQMFAQAKRTYLGLPAPNPSPGGEGFVDVALQQDDRVHLQLLDDHGNPVLTLLNGMELKGGVHRVEFNHRGLPSGVYAIQMLTASGKAAMQRMVIAR
ncbi:MAG: IgGFc-binding protein [Armatimonadetes bacterium]|nr:IgGFc-binding protein [Armatimonadota bacterium]